MLCKSIFYVKSNFVLCNDWVYKEQDENHSGVSLQTSLGFVVACLRVVIKSLSILYPDSPIPHVFSYLK